MFIYCKYRKEQSSTFDQATLHWFPLPWLLSTADGYGFLREVIHKFSDKLLKLKMGDVFPNKIPKLHITKKHLNDLNCTWSLVKQKMQPCLNKSPLCELMQFYTPCRKYAVQQCWGNGVVKERNWFHAENKRDMRVSYHGAGAGGSWNIEPRHQIWGDPYWPGLPRGKGKTSKWN